MRLVASERPQCAFALEEVRTLMATSNQARLKMTTIVILCALSASCAGERAIPEIGSMTAPGDSATGCRRVFAAIRAAVGEAGVGDAQYAEIAGFPYLRANRFWAAIGGQLDGEDPRSFASWVERLRRLGADATRFELANLPPNARARLGGPFAEPGGGGHLVEACGEVLIKADLADAARRAELRAAARVPDSYSALARFVGLYPLTSIPVAAGWDAWKRDNLASFTQPEAALPVRGTLMDFIPPAAPDPLMPGEIADVLARNADPLLGVAEPTGNDLARLVASFAPVWRIDVAGPSDEIGVPNWPTAHRPVAVEPHRPTTFVHVGHALFAGRPVLQISYQVWFASRPKAGPLDLLGGRLDSVIWRVFIGGDGRPLVYDTVHACGCYHLLFPVPPVRPRPFVDAARGFDETATVPAAAPLLAPNRRAVVRLAAGSHYVVALGATGDEPPTKARVYEFADANALRSMAVPGDHRRSLYGDDGLVAGTERLERFILWPMGVASPGAMRQWGNHATAFVGRRHFDDPHLLDEAFVR